MSITVDGAAAAETDADGALRAARRARRAPRCRSSCPVTTTPTSTVDAGAGAAADAEVLFRLAPRLTGERYETTVRTARPEIPRVEVSGEEARAVAGTSGDPLRVIGSLPGVSQIVLAAPRSTSCAAPTPATPASIWTACACRRCSTSRSARR